MKTHICGPLYFWPSVSMQSCMLFKKVGKSFFRGIYVFGSKAEIKAPVPGSVHYLSYAFPHDWVTVTSPY